MTVSDQNRPQRRRTKKPEPVEPLLTTADVAELAQVSPETVRRWRYDGDLPFFRLGYRTIRYRADDVEQAIMRVRRTST